MVIILVIAIQGNSHCSLARKFSFQELHAAMFASDLQCIFFNSGLIMVLNYKVLFRQFAELESKGS